MKFSFHPEAKNELDEGVRYYENCQPGLGIEFLKEVYATIQRILEYPLGWTPLSSNTRRCLTNRFPYGIIYQILDDEIYIIAVMHLNRRPSYYKERIK